MKNSRMHVWEGRIWNGYLSIALALIMLSTAACQPEEKKQRNSLQTIDTLQKTQPAKETSGNKMVFPGGDTIQQNCEFIQEQAESLLEEYYRGKITKARARQILTELKKLEQEWKQAGCQQVFGYMAPHLPASIRTGKQEVK